MGKIKISKDDLTMKLRQLAGYERPEEWDETTTVSTVNEIVNDMISLSEERDRIEQKYVEDFTNNPVNPIQDSNNETEPPKKILVSDYIDFNAL